MSQPKSNASTAIPYSLLSFFARKRPAVIACSPRGAGAWHPPPPVLAHVPCCRLDDHPRDRRKHAQHALRIEPVRLGPSGSAVDAGWFKNMANDTICRQQTVQPEAVTRQRLSSRRAREQHGPAGTRSEPTRRPCRHHRSDADVTSPTRARERDEPR